MKWPHRILAAVGGAGALALLLLWAKPPELIRIGSNYAAKIVCSNVFLAGREPAEVLRVDVQAPGLFLLRLMRVSVDRDRGVVRTGLFGFIGRGLAVYRPGAGCAVVPDGKLDIAAAHVRPARVPPPRSRLAIYPGRTAAPCKPTPHSIA